MPGGVVTAVARLHDVHPNLLHHGRRQAKLAAGGRACCGKRQSILSTKVGELCPDPRIGDHCANSCRAERD